MREILHNFMDLTFLPGVSLCVVLIATNMVASLRAYAGTSNQPESEGNAYARWENGPSSDPGYFPIAVWLQNPENARRYKAAGINLYVGLWEGPTEAQLSALKEVGMSVICAQNEVGLKHRDDLTIIGWMHGDEPDNAQSMENVWKNDLTAIKKALLKTRVLDFIPFGSVTPLPPGL